MIEQQRAKSSAWERAHTGGMVDQRAKRSAWARAHAGATTVRILQRFEVAAAQKRRAFRQAETERVTERGAVAQTGRGIDRLIDGVVESHLEAARSDGAVKHHAVLHHRAGRIEYAPGFEATARSQLASIRTPARGVIKTERERYLTRPKLLAPLDVLPRRPCSAPAFSPLKIVKSPARAVSLGAGAMAGLPRKKRTKGFSFVQTATACLVAMRIMRHYMLKRHGRTHRNLLVAMGRFSGAGSYEKRCFDASIWRRPSTSRSSLLGGAGRARVNQNGAPMVKPPRKPLRPPRGAEASVVTEAVRLRLAFNPAGQAANLKSALETLDAALHNDTSPRA